MRKYELVAIVHPDLDETAFNGVVERSRVGLQKPAVSVDKVEVWGESAWLTPSRSSVKVNT